MSQLRFVEIGDLFLVANDVNQALERLPEAPFQIVGARLLGGEGALQLLDAGPLRDRFELLRFRHQQRGRFVGADDARRMRIERHHDGGRAALAGYAVQTLENLAMPAMQAVEVAEGEQRVRPLQWARILWEMNDVHDYTSIT